MFDVDSLPDMYETMIDQPALIYDSFANFSTIIVKNLTSFCSFLANELNYTEQGCFELFNNTMIDLNQVSFLKNS